MVLISYFTLMIAVVLWIVRIVATIMANLGTEFPITVFNISIEIPLLFITFFSFLFILKRKIIGALIYMISYLGYFGIFLYNIFSKDLIQDNYLNIIVSILCIAVPIFVFLDVGLNRNQKNFGLHKKTDWFYNNEQFDRNLDERADKNQYKY